MSYEGVKQLSRERLTEVQQLLNHIASLEPDDATTPHPAEVKILRGFFYVHLYAALEKSVNEAVQLTLRLIASHNAPANHYELGFGSITSRGKLQAFKSCSYKSYHNNAVAIFSTLESSDKANIDETQFSDSLMNVWTNSILEVFHSFGITTTIDPRTRATIDELVENRNKVAHGRESALTVGERHRSNILRDKFTITTGMIDLVISNLELFYTTRSFIKTQERNSY
ncbi:MAE_28990/MAE_18760 family HEPN-like nuclease [Pseudomonas sp. NPDC089743]|uniref:MAE_28990/MAE_18760 family HEPN-like nuclease n=1 Tax=Pseudomonas sp. NPDC089743 TaxID=3364471 RepID=UPI003824B6BF